MSNEYDITAEEGMSAPISEEEIRADLDRDHAAFADRHGVFAIQRQAAILRRQRGAVRQRKAPAFRHVAGTQIILFHWSNAPTDIQHTNDKNDQKQKDTMDKRDMGFYPGK